MEKLSVLKEIWLRLQQESPDLFKKISKYSIYLAALAGAALGLEWMEIITLPEKLSTALWSAVMFFLGSAGTAKLPVKTADGPGGDIPKPPTKPTTPPGS